MKARSARSAVLGVAVVAALATGGLAYGSAAEPHDHSTADARIGKAAPPGTTSVGGTASMQPKRGVQPSKTIPKESTADKRSTASSNPKGTSAWVDKSDRGVKGAKATKDRVKKNAAPTRDRGAR
jgi:hypothetical protein